MPVVKDIPGGRTGSGSLRFASAIRYAATVNDRTSEIAAVSERFAAFLDHAAERDMESIHEPHRGERVEQVILSGIFSLETAAYELDAIAALRPRVSDPVRHIVLSYDTARGERPSPEQIDGDVKTLLRQRGFTDAQDRSQRHHGTAAARFEAARRGDVSPFVAIVHGDTASKHVHVIVSTVAPNGVVNSDFRRYGANEHAAAMIAQAHGWEIVAGRKNGRLVAEQARRRGASDAEIEALLRRDAVTLDRLRERDLDLGYAQQSGTTRSDTGKANKRGSFISEHGEAIRDAFTRSKSLDDFKDALREIGVVAKYSEAVDRKTGRVLPRLAFADALDAAGGSGSRVGVAAKSLIGKFGPIATEARSSIGFGTALADGEPETGRSASADGWSPARPRSSPGDAEVPEPGKRGTGSPDLARSASESPARELAPAGRALATAVLRRKPVLPRRLGSLDWMFAVLGFASGSMRAVRRRRQERRRQGPQSATGWSRAEDASPRRSADAQDRQARKRATILARDARTPTGVEARDRALADLDMRASYAAWKDAETEKQLIDIRAKRAEAFAAHERETKAQLQRAWEVEGLFREALRSVNVRGADARRAMAEAYEARRSAILAARKVIWAAVDAVSPKVKTYADWLMEQSGVIADRARAQFEADIGSKAAKRGTVDVDHPVQVASKEHGDPARQIVVPAAENSAPKVVLRRSSRFSAILERTDAEASHDEAVRRATSDAEKAEKARVDKDAALERAVVKAARKILGPIALLGIDELRKTSHGPDRTAAVADLRKMIVGAGVQRRSRRAAGVPEAGAIRRVPRPKDVRSR